MRALISREGKFDVVEVPVPEVGAGQVRVKVKAAAVNPIDLMTAAGGLPGAGIAPERAAYALGWDVAGTVEQVGEGVRWKVGAEVIGLSDRLTSPVKAQAEYVVLDAGQVAAAPAGVSAEAAATLPLNGLTALQALELAGLEAGQTLLVTGAAGAVGGFAVELAALRGLRVVAVAGEQDEKAVRGFGAEWFVPRGADLAEEVRRLVPGGVHGVVDAAVVGLEALDAVRNGGAFVSVLPGAAPPPLRGIKAENVFVRADAEQLTALSLLAGAGRLSLRVEQTHPLEEAATAYARLAAGGTRGRQVLLP